MMEASPLIGRITRCSTRGFVGAIRLPEPDMPTFGSYCKASAQQGQSQVVGLIYDIAIEDDEFTRQVATAEDPPIEQVADQQIVRTVPIEVSALAIGYLRDGDYHQALPPQPPLTLARIYSLNPEEILAFTERLDFLPLILTATTIPVDELLIAALRGAALVRPESERNRFLIEAGRACARFMTQDLVRLENILRNVA
jgi:hypothetical protein